MHVVLLSCFICSIPAVLLVCQYASIFWYDLPLPSLVEVSGFVTILASSSLTTCWLEIVELQAIVLGSVFELIAAGCCLALNLAFLPVACDSRRNCHPKWIQL